MVLVGNFFFIILGKECFQVKSTNKCHSQNKNMLEVTQLGDWKHQNHPRQQKPRQPMKLTFAMQPYSDLTN